MKKIIIIFSLIALSGFITTIIYSHKSYAAQGKFYQVEQAVKSLLKDPYSVKFSKMVSCRKGFVWGTINAKNSFGAYIGDKIFVSDGGEFTYIMSDNPKENIVLDTIIQANCLNK